MSLVNSFLSTCLPDVGAEDVSASRENKVSTCVVSLQLTSALAVNKAGNLAAYDVKISGDLAVDQMEYDFANLNYLGDIEWLLESLNGQHTSVVSLSSRSWVERTLIKDD